MSDNPYRNGNKYNIIKIKNPNKNGSFFVINKNIPHFISKYVILNL